MKKLLLTVVFFLFLQPLFINAFAAEYIAPEAPDAAQELLPVHRQTFWEGVLEILDNAFDTMQPSFSTACRLCAGLLALALLVRFTECFFQQNGWIVNLVAALGASLLLFSGARSMILLAGQTVRELSEYGKLLLPVMTASLAAQGGGTTSAALYAGTAVFDTLLSKGVSALLQPLVFVYLILSTLYAATGEDIVDKLRELVKGFCSWGLKTVLYIFTGYITVTGVVSGATDAAALKATKLTISGMIPVVGGILSDASEALLVGAGLMKNAAGIYGMLTLIALWIAPFLQIGLQYLLLKVTAMACQAFGSKQLTGLIGSFSTAMGLLLAMTGAVCFMLLISTVCFMKGVS